jgi:MinD-like ATPase involved in chromosome partitioning or flagellar assembly
VDMLTSADLADLVGTVTAAGTAAPDPPTTPTVVAGAGEGGSPSGRVLVVWGPAGAPGRTTVAVGIATEAARAGAEVLLADVDPYGGTVAGHLGVLDEVSGLLAAARAANTGQLDRVRLAGLARQVGDGLRVLTGLPRPDRWQEVRPAAFAELLGEAARLAPWLVLDAGFSLESDPVPAFGGSGPQRNEMTVASLQRADEVVVVGAADPIGLARLARGLVELHELLPALRPRVVVNRTRTTLGWSDREIRGMVEGFVRPVDVHFLPEDRAAADRALMAGRSLAESGDSALRRAMSELAHGVLGRPAARTGRRGRGSGRGR